MNYQTSMPDEKLIQFYLNGNLNAMASFVELYKDRVYQSIYNILQDKHVAEEIFQQVFICLINNMIAGRVAEEGNFAIDCCTKITGLQQLKKDMRSNIVKGLSKILGTANTIDADELLDNIFYNNGKNFLLKRIKEIKG